MSDGGDEGNKPSEVARLRSKAIKLLAGREHSEKELLQKLARATARSAQRERTAAQRNEKAAQKQASRATQTSLDNGFDAGEVGEITPISGRYPAKSAEIAPQVLSFVEPMSARELAHANAQSALSALESLKADGYQSDKRYAESITRHLAGRMSKSAIAGKLKAAGVARDEIDDALAQSLSEAHSDDLAVAQALWQTKFRNPPADEKEKAKHVRFLQSRGFSISTALRVLRVASAAIDES